MARGTGVDDPERGRRLSAAPRWGGSPHDDPDVGHLWRLRGRYPDLAGDIQRLIGLARRERQLRTPRASTIMAEAPGAGSAWKTDMGITIVQKSDLTVRKRNPRVALVLAGPAARELWPPRSDRVVGVVSAQQPGLAVSVDPPRRRPHSPAVDRPRNEDVDVTVPVRVCQASAGCIGVSAQR